MRTYGDIKASRKKAKNGSTQNRTGVLRTKILYAAPTPWNLSKDKGDRKKIMEIKRQKKKEKEGGLAQWQSVSLVKRRSWVRSP